MTINCHAIWACCGLNHVTNKFPQNLQGKVANHVVVRGLTLYHIIPSVPALSSIGFFLFVVNYILRPLKWTWQESNLQVWPSYCTLFSMPPTVWMACYIVSSISLRFRSKGLPCSCSTLLMYTKQLRLLPIMTYFEKGSNALHFVH